MWQVSRGTVTRCKRRKIFAIRNFPPGCGPNAVKLSRKHAEETCFPGALEKGVGADKVLVASCVVEEPPVSHSPTVKKELHVLSSAREFTSEIAKLLNGVMPVARESDAEIKTETVKLEEQELCDSSESPMLQNGYFYKGMYNPPKRRKVFAIRKFPNGCGPQAENVSRDGRHPFCDEAILQKANIRVKDDKERIKENHGINTEPTIIPPIASPKFKSLDMEKNPFSQQQEMSRCSQLVASTKVNLHEVDNKPLVKQLLVIEGSEQFEDAKNTLDLVKSRVKKSGAVDEPLKSVSSEKVGAENTSDSKVSVGKELDVDKGKLFRSNSDKHVIGSGGQGTNIHIHIRSPTKAGPNRILARSSSDKTLNNQRVNQSMYNLQHKANSASTTNLVANSQLGSKLVDNENRPLVQKPPVKEYDIIQKGVKRKFLKDVLYKDCILYEDDDSLEVTGERMITQAIVAGQNCPWKIPKKHDEVSCCSPALKSKLNEEDKKSVLKCFLKIEDKKSFAKGFPLSQWNNKGLTGDDNDDVLVKERKYKRHTSYQKPNEWNITMTPFAPPEFHHKGGDGKDKVARHKVKRVLRLFQLICRKLLQVEESRRKTLGKANRIDLHASTILKDNGEWLNKVEPIIGTVPGVEIGDEFHYRVELSIVGLHRPFQAGIDFTKKKGMLVATSIVASGGYQDDMDSSDILLYSGSGGNSTGGDKQPGDQKLERGNLSLKNCIDTQTPVRVIHGFKDKGNDSLDAKGKLVSTFIYDGLYLVETYWMERGIHGFNVFKFQLKRMPGQPELAFKVLKHSAKIKNRQGLCIKDISQGKERIQISVVNTIDNEQPVPFKYFSMIIYPSWYVKKPPSGCNCSGRCSDSDMCACAVKNGGEIPYNFNGAIVQAKPLIYECGPSCKCPPSCHNRVSQHGVRVQLEVFKTIGRGWGVRSLRSISSGSFICEYIGELLQDGEAEQRTNDEYLFDIGHNYDDHSLWEGLPNLIPELQSISACDTVETVGFTIDAAKYGNVGRFINHSCSPNLYAQNVLYDHDDKRVPHIMFFAVDNIPPLQELTYHYNYTVDQVHDSEGNIKQKACCCGSPECCGRLY